MFSFFFTVLTLCVPARWCHVTREISATCYFRNMRRPAVTFWPASKQKQRLWPRGLLSSHIHTVHCSSASCTYSAYVVCNITPNHLRSSAHNLGVLKKCFINYFCNQCARCAWYEAPLAGVVLLFITSQDQKHLNKINCPVCKSILGISTILYALDWWGDKNSLSLF